MLQLRSPREFYAGAIYIAFGAVGLWFGWAYPMGTAGRMGGGYFPKVLSVVLIALGLVALYRGLRISGPALAAIRFKPLLLILAACSLFGILLEPIGLIGALLVLIIMAAMASDQFRWSPVAIAGALALVAACALVFVWGLSVPLPLLGSWLKPN
ncbi:MAG: tripartite tricarboxylate transporter TctB family protein [Bosea sp. (in: a-proteobacteria)]